jgi:hypothetical protein
VPLDTPAFMAARVRYFSITDELRANNSRIFFHDETWCNQYEERRYIWTDVTTGIDRMRNSGNKGSYCFFHLSVGYSVFYRETISNFCSSEQVRLSQRNY